MQYGSSDPPSLLVFTARPKSLQNLTKMAKVMGIRDKLHFKMAAWSSPPSQLVLPGRNKLKHFADFIMTKPGHNIF